MMSDEHLLKIPLPCNCDTRVHILYRRTSVFVLYIALRLFLYYKPNTHTRTCGSSFIPELVQLKKLSANPELTLHV